MKTISFALVLFALCHCGPATSDPQTTDPQQPGDMSTGNPPPTGDPQMGSNDSKPRDLSFIKEDSTYPCIKPQVADFDGDKALDLYCYDQAQGTAWVRYNLGDATFSSVVDAPSKSNQLEVLDANGDGRADLLSLGYNSLTLYISNSNRTFTSHTQSLPTLPTAPAVADTDGDGFDELILPFPDGNYSIAFDANGGSRSTTKLFASTYQCTWADVDADGKDDCLRGTTNGLVLRTAASGWSPVTIDTGRHIDWIGVGDFNADKKRDIAFHDSEPTGSVVVVLKQQMDGSFARTFEKKGISADLSFAVTDLDGDKRDDLAMSSLVVRGTDKMDFSDGWQVQASIVGFADFNADGKMDYLAWGVTPFLQQ